MDLQTLISRVYRVDFYSKFFFQSFFMLLVRLTFIVSFNNEIICNEKLNPSIFFFFFKRDM